MHGRNRTVICCWWIPTANGHIAVLQAGLADPTEPPCHRDEGQTSKNPPEAVGSMLGKPKNLSCIRLSSYVTSNYLTGTWIKSLQIHGNTFCGSQGQGKAFPPLWWAHCLPTEGVPGPTHLAGESSKPASGSPAWDSPANPLHLAALIKLQLTTKKQHPIFQDVSERTYIHP